MIHTITILLLAIVIASCATGGIRSDNDERSFSAYIELANTYLQQGNVRSAANSLEQAAAIDENDPRLLHAYGLYYQLSNQNEEAEEMFTAALEKAPDFSRARNNYGVFLSNADRNAEALVELSKAAKDPNYPLRAVAYENLTEVALKVDNLPLAVESMKNAALIAPSQKRYFLRSAHLLYLNQDFDQGQEYFDRFMVMNDSEGIEPTSEALQIGFAIATARKDKAAEEYIRQRMRLLGPQINNDK